MTMGLASGTMMLFTVMNAMNSGSWSHAVPTIAMSGSMMTGVILWPVLAKRFDRKRRRKKEALRQTRFRAYLQNIQADIQQECLKQAQTLRSIHIPIDTCVSRIRNRPRTLWERAPGRPDFLVLSLGLGDLPLDADITYPQHRFALEDDNLRQQILALRDNPRILRDVPITLSLTQDYISGIIGDRQQVIDIAQGLIIQLAALCSYDDVKLIFIYDPQDEPAFGFTKWLPHIWDDQRTIRFLASTPGEVKEISAYLEQEIAHRAQLNDKALENAAPYYVIFSLSPTLAQGANMFRQYHTHKKNLNLSVLTFCDQLGRLPKESTLVVELSSPTATN